LKVPLYRARYRTILADPPWPFQWGGGKGGRRRRETELGYKTMTVAEIAAIPVQELADPGGCNLFMWATDETYREGQAVSVARAWGFEPVGPAIIWRKENFGTGLFPRPAHEMLMVCRTRNVPAFWTQEWDAAKGKWKWIYEVVATHSVQSWGQERGVKNGGKQHSRKPEGAADLIEIVSPGPYLEMFSRRTRFGWDSWGDQALNHVQLPVRCPTGVACTGCRYCENAWESLEATEGSAV
jgi:N6-adenosine-specific RNA methylase IME4